MFPCYRYITFFLDLIATNDNIGLLYHIALKAKTVRDAESHVYSEVNSVTTVQTCPPFTQCAETLRLRGACAIPHQGSCQGALMES